MILKAIYHMSISQNHTIWIVEDDLDDRILLHEAFKDTLIPCSVQVFADAFSALQQLGVSNIQELPTIIVSDYNMPVMNGADFIEALCVHRRYDTIVKIILSTSSYLFDTEECLARGAHGYFIKPANYPAMVDVAFSIFGLANKKFP